MKERGSLGNGARRNGALRSVSWGVLAQIANMASGVGIITVAAAVLSPGELGLWFVFLSIGGAVQLLEVGLGSAILRSVAYATAGAEGLAEHGILPRERQGENAGLLHRVLSAGAAAYVMVGCLAAAVLLGPGTLFVYNRASAAGLDLQSSVAAWVVFAAGSTLNLSQSYQMSVLQGLGKVDASNRALASSRLLFLGAGLLFLAGGGRVLGISVASCLGVVALAATAYWQLRREIRVRLGDVAVWDWDIRRHREVLVALLPNARRQALSQVGAFLIQRGGTLVLSALVGLERTATWGLTTTAVQAIQNLALVPGQIATPRMAYHAAAGDLSHAWRSYRSARAVGLAMCSTALAALYFVGEPLLALIGSSAGLIPQWQVALYSLVVILEVNHTYAAFFISANNAVPFAVPAILSGVAVFFVTALCVPAIGTAGVILAQGVVQVAYNNWKWPRMALTMRGKQTRPLDCPANV